MRKIIIIAVAVTMMSATLLTGCGSPGSAPNEAEKTEQSIKENASADSESKAEMDAETEAEKAKDVMIEEVLLVDQDGLKITAKGLGKGIFGDEIKLLIENEGEKNVTVQARNTSVNGYMVDNMMSEDVASGKKANTSLTLYSSEMDACGIETIGDIGIQFHVFDSESWDAVFDTETVEIHTSASGTFKQIYDDTGIVLVDDGGIRIIAKGISDDSIWGPGVILYIENNTDTGFTVQSRDTSVNGFMMDGMLSKDVLPGMKAVAALTFLSSYLEDNEIEEISSVETSFHIFSMDGWDTILDTGMITITF